MRIYLRAQEHKPNAEALMIKSLTDKEIPSDTNVIEKWKAHTHTKKITNCEINH